MKYIPEIKRELLELVMKKDVFLGDIHTSKLWIWIFYLVFMMMQQTKRMIAKILVALRAGMWVMW